MKTITILLFATLMLASCYSTLHLHNTGTYTIKQRAGDVTEFYEVKGKYTIISDTLKKNDKIVINVIKAGGFKRSNKRKPEEVPNNNALVKE
ncbi:hypothetical protein BH11BAC3_BH11BAC3_22410 [soil metagenome]